MQEQVQDESAEKAEKDRSTGTQYYVEKTILGHVVYTSSARSKDRREVCEENLQFDAMPAKNCFNVDASEKGIVGDMEKLP